MNLFRLFDSLAQHDEDFYDRIATRRASIRQVGELTRKAGLASLGAFFGGVLNKAYAGERGIRDAVIDTVRFALQLERAELGLYTQARTLPIFSAANREALDLIFANESDHVTLLERTYSDLLGNPPTLPPMPRQEPDLTGSANGTMPPLVPTALTNEMDCIMVLQGSEENGGRAYRGNADQLMSNDAVLQAALQLHSVEARHAAHWRMVRGRAAWVQNADLDEANGKVPAMVYAKVGNDATKYPNENNTAQAGQSGFTTVGAGLVAEAFDEGLDPASVAALAMPFGFKMP